MLSIAKLRVGQEAYTLAGVAQSLDDYYTGAGEATGVWLGTGAERLGLVGDVAPDDLRAVLAGMAPGSGGLTPDGRMVRTHVRRVPGFDLTFKAPKSVSVLYAVSDDPRVQVAIIEAGETAVRETVSWLEREAIRVRRGSADVAYLNDLAARDPEAADAARIRVLRGRGVVAATFRHRTSRAGDPLLHWHTLVANLVEGPDGRWGAFVHPELYRSVRAAGELFQTVLRGELTQRLGVEWRPGRHVFEVAGVPQAVCGLFSKRSREIEAWLDATGTPDDPAGRQAAVLATRRGKPELEGERFDAAWKAEASAAGWGPEQAAALIAATVPGQATELHDVWQVPVMDEVSGEIADVAVDAEEWIGEVGRGLTVYDATFTRPQLVQAVAGRIGPGANAATVDRAVARTLASSQLVPITDAQVERWTTVEQLGVEQRFFDTVHAGRGRCRPLGQDRVGSVLAGVRGLGTDQAFAVRVLTGSADALSVLVGPAGTGKTYTLDALRRVFDSAGFEVVGAAPSARAAHELAAGAHIPASTIHRLTGSWSRGYDLPSGRTVLVVDEAAMAGIRDLEHVVTTVAAAGGRVVLVGDHHQLPEVTAGGGFAALAGDPAVTVAELTVNRRQHEPWERAALSELRYGHVAQAVAAYRDHDRVIVADDRTVMIDVAVERWLTAHRDGINPVLLAGTNETVNALNTAVRRRLLALGWLHEPVDGHDGTLAFGERLMIRANNYRAVGVDGHRVGVLNGQTGTLTDVRPDGVVVRIDDGADVVVAHDALGTGAVGYAYASTAHRAQGGTWDLAITVGLDGLYREAGYLVMSRGRASNSLVITAPELDAIDDELARHDSTIPLLDEEPNDVDEALLGRLTTTRGKQLAVTRDPHAVAIHTAATTIELGVLEERAAYAAAVETQASRIIGTDPIRLRERLARTEHTARHAAVGHRVKATDRRNIGTIIALDDTAGTVDVTFVATDGRTATRTPGWGDVAIVDPRHPADRELDVSATATLDRLTGEARSRLTRWDNCLAGHGVAPTDRHVYEQAARLVVDRAAAGLTAAHPGWLVALIGSRPDRPAAVQVWDDAARDLAAHRLRHDVTDPRVPTTPDTAAPALWNAVSPSLARARVWLDAHATQPGIAVTRTRSHRELHARRGELDTILAAAPPDVRGLLERLDEGGMLPLDDTAALVDQALATRGERRRWILQHWPHVVERAQISQTLESAAAGPDPDPLVAALAASPHADLAAAASGDEEWLVTLAAQLVPPDTGIIEPGVEQVLADVAGYRTRWDVTDPDPLGIAAIDVDQANERAVLAIAIDHLRADIPPTQLLDNDEVIDRGVGFDVADALGW